MPSPIDNSQLSTDILPTTSTNINDQMKIIQQQNNNLVMMVQQLSERIDRRQNVTSTSLKTSAPPQENIHPKMIIQVS